MNSIRTRLGLLFILFFLLITISVGATFWSLQAQAGDALLINLAGRQRMLVQLMTRLASETPSDPNAAAALAEAAAAFDATLQALIGGGPVQYPGDTYLKLRPVPQPEVQQQLRQVERLWNVYASELEVLLSVDTTAAEASASLSAIRLRAPELVNEADQTVRLLQDASRLRIQRIRLVQVSFFIAALVLLGAGTLLVQKGILIPLKQLEASADRIRRGNLQTPVEDVGPAEISQLARSFESMRSELEISHQQLARWAQTLEEEVKKRTRELDALYGVSQEILARLDRREVLNSVTTRASELLQAEVAFICMLNEQGDKLKLQAASGPDDTVKCLSSPVNNPFVKIVIQQPSGISCSASGCAGTCGIMDERYRASHLASPLVVGERVIGALCVGDRRKAAFSADAPALLARLASAAAVAIENARLYEQAEHLAALEERQRIAASMHDGLAQSLDALGLLLEQASDRLENGACDQAGEILNSARRDLRQASGEVRRTIASLQEEPLQPRSLQEQLRELIQQQVMEAGPAIDWQVEMEGALFLPSEDACQILGIVQEALVNTRRHAGARKITLELEQREAQGWLNITDDGCGFDPAASPADGRPHFGLQILAARAAHLGGELTIDSAPGKGTRISLTWPLRKLPVPVSVKQKELL